MGTWNWAGRILGGERARGRRSALPTAEALETRVLLAVRFRFDYRYDTGGFFRDPQRRRLLELAGRMVADRIDTGLAAITPKAGRSWTTSIVNPRNGKTLIKLKDPKVGADEILVYVGAKGLKRDESLETAELAVTRPDRIQSLSGPKSWRNLLKNRGIKASGDNAAIRIVSMSFNSDYKYHFGVTTEGLNDDSRDFLSLAVHELGHAAGIGLTDPWHSQIVWYSNVKRLVFAGEHVNGFARDSPWASLFSVGLFQGNAAHPTAENGNHWADSVRSDGLLPAMSYYNPKGDRHLFSELDQKALLDIGYAARKDNQAGGADDTLTTARHVLTSDLDNPLGSLAVSYSGDGKFDRARDVDIYRVYAKAGERIEVMAVGGAGADYDPTVRVFDLTGSELGSDIGGPASPAFSPVTVRLGVDIDREDYYFVAISSHAKVDYNPFRAESGQPGGNEAYDFGILIREGTPVV